MESVIIEVKPISQPIIYSYDSSENLNEIAIHIKMPNNYKYINQKNINQKNKIYINKTYNSFFDNTNKE